MKKIIQNIPQKHFFILIDLVMIVLGIIGVVGGLLNSLLFPQLTWISIILLIVYAWIFYISYANDQPAYRKNLHYIVLFVFALSTCFYMNDWITLMIELKNVILHDYFLDFQDLFQVSLIPKRLFPIIVLFFIGLPITHLIVSLICQKKRSLLRIFVLIILFVFPAFIMHPFDSITSYCFIFFISYEFIFGYTLQYQKQQLALKTVMIVGLSLLLFISSLFMEGNPLFDQSTSYVLRNVSHWFHVQNITGTSTTIDGALPTDNVQLNNQLALKVTASKPISTYLRGYSLANYKNNEWFSVEEDYPEVNSTNVATYWIGNYIGASAIEMTIEPTIATTYQFVPYFTRMAGKEIDDSYYAKTNDSLMVLPMYSQDIESFYEKYNTLREYEDYTQYVYREYMYVSPDLKDQLIHYIESKSGLFIDEITQDYQKDEIVDMVKEYLFEDTSYDLNTGALPADQDFVEYFLFVNHKGSCTHYASTAALMLRCLGIPTRFVKGYVMKASDFHENTAEILSNRSHAWIEIYLDGKGWIPVEVTPSGRATNNVTSMADSLDEHLQNSTTVIQQPQQNQTTQQPNPDNITQQGTPSSQQNQSWGKWIQTYGKHIRNILLFVSVLFIYRRITRLWFPMRLKKKSSNQQAILYYQRIQRILRFGGEPDQHVKELVYKAKFSQHILDDCEILYIQKSYQELIKHVYQSLNGYKKWIYKYIYGYY